MADWAAFAGVSGVVLVLLLLLARASQDLVTGGTAPAVEESRTVDSATASDESALSSDEPAPRTDAEATGDESVTNYSDGGTDAATGSAAGDQPPRSEPVGIRQLREDPNLSTGALLANVALSQGLFAALLLGAAWYFSIPAWALGFGSGTAGWPAVALGVGLGVGLYVGNELGAALGARVGFEQPEELRRALAPDSAVGWAVLLLLVLPIIAGFEELLFRGILIGALHVGFDISPWLLAVGSSVAFALGHGAQGRLGMFVTGSLGFVLAGAFVVTNSLLLVVVAHYVINALEFVVHEGLGVEWASAR
ncbi:lysostaphin resistance A-like protein [Haloferacaceae archaeon DSL9]